MFVDKVIIAQYISKQIAENLHIEINSVQQRQPFFALGITSLVSEEILMSLSDSYNDISSTLLFEYPTVEKLAKHLSAFEPVANAPILDFVEQEPIPKNTKIEDSIDKSIDPVPAKDNDVSSKHTANNTQVGIAEDIAIIGISGQFPQANTPDELWTNLVSNIDSITEVPKSRWDADALFSTEQTNRNALFGKWGGFIDDIEYFDPSFFKIPYREAEIMDPQQKLFLQCGWSLMENAGYGDIDARPTDNIGVYSGITWNEFSVIAHDAQIKEQTYKGAGSLYWSVPNRLSYTLNLKGPSVAIDSACSSSLVAIQEACMSLQTGKCEMAIAGGVNLNLHPNKYLFLSQNHFLSSEGKCRSFGEGGDGYVPSEGVAAVLLKPLSKAEKDGDYIYGVIKAATNNHGGKVTGYTVPNPAAHTALIEQALDDAKIDVNDIGFIECHGTGTSLGDPIEITGLTNAFANKTDNKSFCAIGSIKSNIGHLEAAAGVTGLIKILLSMKHGLLPASLHSKVENQKLSLEQTPFYLLKENTPWDKKNDKLTASVSSFGAGGSNAHIIVESHSGNHFEKRSNTKANQILVLSAQSKKQLNEQAENLQKFIKEFANSDQAKQYQIRDIAYSLITGRSHFKYRLAIQVKSFSDIDKELRGYLAGKAHLSKNIFVGESENELDLASDKPLPSNKASKTTASKWAEMWSQGLCHAHTYCQLKAFTGKENCLKYPLPTYPFLKERSWITEGYPLVHITSGSNKENSNEVILHPLVDKNISTLYEQKFEKVFHVSEFVLTDHLVNDVHVIPGVCHLEMVRQCAAEATKEDIITIQDVWYYNVISVEEQRKVEIELTVENETLNYNIHDHLTDTVFSRGKIAWSQPDSAAVAVETIDVLAIEARIENSWNIDDVYSKFVATGIIQKESFQVLKAIGFNQSEALSKLCLPANLIESFDQFVFHPALMDGLVQTAMMHVQYLLGKDVKILPFHFSKVSFIKPLEQNVFVHCRVKDEVNKEFNLTLCNLAGEPLVDVSSFILKEMKNAADEDTLTMQEHNFASYYVPEFVELPLKNANEENELTLCFIGKNKDIVKDNNHHNIIWVKNGNTFNESEHGFEIRYNEETDYIKLVERLKERKQLPQLVIYSSESITNSTGDYYSKNNVSMMSELTGVSLFLLAKSIIPKCQKLDWVVFADGRIPSSDPVNLAAIGFFKTLKIEKPSFEGRVIALDHAPDSLNQLQDFALRDMATQNGVISVEYRQGKRFFTDFKNADEQVISSEQVNLRQKGTYLITGGLGGIGLVFAKYFIDNFDATVFLTGRSILNEKSQALLDGLNQGNGQANYLRCDVSSLSDVETSIAEILADKGMLHGVIHSAGTIEDSFILRKDFDSFKRVIEPKTRGVLNLDWGTRDIELDFFCLFSSITAILGNLGQCDYGYANAFEDNLVRYRNALAQKGERKGRAVSINWPYWKEGGMQLSDNEERQLRQGFGITPLSNESGIEAFLFSLKTKSAQLAVLEGDQRKINSLLSLSATEEPTPSINANTEDVAGVHQLATDYLINIFAKELKIPRDKIDVNASFERYGFDSIIMIDLINVMDLKFKELPKTLFFEYQTIDELAQYFSANHADSFSTTQLVAKPAKLSAIPKYSPTQLSSVPKSNKQSRLVKKAPINQSSATLNTSLPTNDSIAIIGVSGQFPQSDNIEEYWQNLKSGNDCVSEIPSTLWDWKGFYQEGKSQQGKSYSKWGGFVNDVDKFDASYFNITPKEAEVTDPQERLFLQCATSAIQDAGYTSDKLATINAQNNNSKVNPVGVFVGVMWGDYQLHGVSSEDSATWTTPRSFYWGIANRVSYFHNFTGPSMAVDTACSSSLSAIHLACESIKNGEVEVAIAGGVNLTLHPNKYNLLSEMQFLSSDGRCRSFGEGGDGYVPGDGVGALVLKSLTQAEADGDHIYGVIRGTALNHGGKASGFTVPNPIMQAELIKNAIYSSGVLPRHISYVEAHGTGTSLGDPVEMIGLKKAYQQEDQQYCAIGSVKSNIGHLEAAAGIAAMTKVLLQMKHKKLVPSLHSEQLNSNIDFTDSPFTVQQELSDWSRPQFIDDNDSNAVIEIPRIAGISSFGAGGSNAHIIIEEYTNDLAPSNTDHNHTSDEKHAIVLSATNEYSINAMVRTLSEYLSSESFHVVSPSLSDIAYTLHTGREHFDIRCVFLVNSINDLANKLDLYLERGEASNKEIEHVYQSNLMHSNVLASLFIQESDTQSILEKWLNDNQQEQLGIAWVSGVDIQWDQLYQHYSNMKRISLPTYVFNKKRYWTSLPEPSKSGSHHLHQMLDKNISTIERQLFSKYFSPKDELLLHHKINEVPTLPGSAYIEMALQAAIQSETSSLSIVENGANFQATIKHINWAKPITGYKYGAKVQVELVPFNSGYLFEISKSLDLNDAAHEAVWTPCSQGEVYIDHANSTVNEDGVDLDVLFSSHKAIDKTWLYQQFSLVGYEFGESFDVYKSIMGAHASAVAIISAASITNTSKCFLPPVIVDAAFRTCLALTGTNNSITPLQIPVELGELTLYGQLDQDCVVYAKQAAKVEYKNTQQITYDIDIFSMAGHLLVKMIGFKTQVISESMRTVAPITNTAIDSSTASDVNKENANALVENYLKSILSSVSKISIEDISSEVALEKYGIDSVMIMTMNESLVGMFGELSKTLFFEYQDIQSLAAFFVDNYASIIEKELGDYAPQKTSADAPVKNHIDLGQIEIPKLRDLNAYRNSSHKNVTAEVEQDIAIIGMSGRFPEANSVDELWDILSGGKDCIREIPIERWDHREFYDKDTLELCKTSSKWGGFIDDYNCFDASLFNVLPTQAKSMDPQERLFLQCVWSTLEDAGYTPSGLFNRESGDANVGVFAGTMWNHFDLSGVEESLKGNPTVNFSWDASIANRASYFFNFTGPSMMFDAACSTSLLAIHQACESIRKGECSSAIAGGVNLSIHPYKYEALTQMQMLSAKGRCHSFGAEADGYVPGEGVASVLLKPLSQAIADNDNIYGVIKGGAVNHNGKTNGFTVPNPVAQEKCFEMALGQAKLNPEDISYFEAHGTGTRLGDPIEFNALNNVFKKSAKSNPKCALGSIKSNIGHLEGAAGATSLIKVLLQLKHKRIAPSLHSKELNPNIDFANSSLYVPQQLSDWEVTKGDSRRAAISSLGAGGANTFLVIEEFQGDEVVSNQLANNYAEEHLFIFSAKSVASLKRNLNEMMKFLNRHHEQLSVNNVAYTLQNGRISLEHRLVVKADTLESLKIKLTNIIESSSDNKISTQDSDCWYGVYEQAMEKAWYTANAYSQQKLNVHGVVLSTIAKRWIAGDNIDWSGYYQDNNTPAKRISLPLYQFEQTVFWPNESKPVIQADSIANITDLLDVNISNFTWQKYQKTFASNQFYIDSHQVGSNYVIPGTVLLEMAIQAYIHSSHSAFIPVNVSNIQWLNQGIVEHELLTEIRLQTTNNRFEIASVDTTNDINEYESLFAGEIDKFSIEDHDLTLLPTLKSLLDSYSSSNLSTKELYDYYANLGLHYGDYFRVTSSLYLSNNNALVKLVPFEQKSIAHKAIQPSVLDAALRSTLLALQASDWKQLLVPHSIEELKVIRPLQGVGYAYVQMQEFDSEFQTYAVSDITLYDEEGEVCAVICGFKGVAATIQAEENSRSKNDALTAEVNIVKTSSLNKDVNQSVNFDELNSEATHYVKQAIAQATGIKVDAVKEDQTFESLAIDSITIVKLNKIFEKDFADLSKTLFFECNTAYKVAQYIIEHHYDETYAVCGLTNDDEISEVKESLVSHSVDNQITLSVEPSGADKTAENSVSEQAVNVFVGTQRSTAELIENNDVTWGDNEVVLAFTNHNLPSVEGVTIIPVKFGKVFRQYKGGDKFIVRKDKIADLSKLLDTISTHDRAIKSIAIFEEESIDWLKETNQSNELEQALYSSISFLQNLVKIMTSALPKSNLKITHFHNGLYRTAQPQWEAYTGFANSLADINNHLFLSTVALHPAIHSNKALYSDVVTQELCCLGKDYRTLEYDALGKRTTYNLMVEPHIEGRSEDLPLSENGVYLITGGAGTLGKVICQYLVKLAVSQNKTISIGLLGRSVENEQIKSAISQMSTTSASIFYAQADICNDIAISNKLDEIRKNVGEIKGLVHCAGVSAEKGLLTAENEEFVKPLAAKCIGTTNLDFSTRQDPLDFYLLFSSITSQIGDFGAASYATGNSFQNNFASYRNYLNFLGERQGFCQAIAWPLWQSEGINQNHDVVQLYLDDFGMKAISESNGVEILRQCWASQIEQVAIYFGQKEKILDKLQIDISQEESNAAALVETQPEESVNAMVESESTSAQDVALSIPYTSLKHSLFDSEDEPSRAKSNDDDIAIIGISGVYPGADNVEQLWKNLQTATDSITEIPIERWDYRDYFSSDRHEMGKVCSKWGGFIKNVDHFDSFQFNFAPREAQLVDPQERIFLQTAFHCIEDAGYCKNALRNNKVGVYVGAMWGQYQLFDIDEEQKKYGPPGSSFSAIANQVSYYFDFHGPSLTLDTMCSSSLTAIHLARNSILSGECDYALAGGVNLTIHPDKYQLLARAQFISSDGHCRSFGDGGTGYVPSEGVGAILLKRLSSAIKDGDHIYGVIKSTAINHGGRTNAFTVPNPVAIGDVVSEALDEAKWDPRTVSYVEAHGTGTPLGDPIEINALSRAFNKHTQEGAYCAIGSIKSNIGHLESASGIAGMTKILLQMKHGEIVPSLHSQTLNKNINFDKTPFSVPQSSFSWDKPVLEENGRRVEYPRRAGLSSFGAGGSNSHILLEEYVTPKSKKSTIKGPFIFVFSAKSTDRLNLLINNIYDFVQQQFFDDKQEELEFLANFSFTLQVGRQAQFERLVIVAKSLSEFKDALDSAKEGEPSDSYIQASVSNAESNLENILDVEQKQTMIESFIVKGNLKGLARVWVNSLEVEWQTLSKSLFAGYQPKRLSIPCTPLIPKKCWIKAKPLVAKGYTLESDKTKFSLHPLIDQNVSTLYVQKYFKQFSGNEFYLKDHLVGLEEPLKVLPGVAYFEMARVAAESALGSKIKGISNLIWGAIISVEGEPKDVNVDISTQSGGMQFEINSGSEANKVVHSRGDIILADEDSFVPTPLDLDLLLKGMNRHFETEDLYAYYRSIGFNYGPSFKVTKHIYASELAALSLLELPEYISAEQGFYLHPSLMDGVIRSCLVVVDLAPGEGPMVPFSVESVEIFGPVTKQCYSYAKLVESEALDQNTTSKFDIIVTDMSGNILVDIKGLVARKLSTNNRLNYYTRALTPAPLPASSKLKGDVILALIPSGDTLYAEMAKLNERNSVIYVTAGDSFSHSKDKYTIAPQHKEDYEKLFKSLKQEGIVPNKLIHAFSMNDEKMGGNKAFDTIMKDDYRVDLALDSSVYSMLYTFQALMNNDFSQPVQSIYLYRNLEGVSSAHDIALSSLAKSLLAVNHRFSQLTIGLDNQSAGEIATLIENEFGNSSNYNGIEVSYTESQRYVSQFKHLDLSIDVPSDQKIALVQGGVYIITGGLGKLGQIFAQYLIEQWQAKIILSGRSQYCAQLQEQMNKVCEDKNTLTYVSCDLSDSTSVKNLVEQAHTQFAKVDGIIHSAGVVEDKTILEVEKNDFDRILQPKIHACINLIRACEKANITNLVLFSSVASLLGDLGGGSYAYGNRYLDQVATLSTEKSDSLNILSIGWPLWQTGGMKIPEREAAFYRYSGMTAISEEQGLVAFECALNSGLPNVIVAPGNNAKISALLKINNEKPSLLASTHKQLATNATDVTTVQKTITSNIANNDASGSNGLMSYLSEALSEIINCPVDEVEPSTQFQHYGLNSVLLMEFNKVLESKFSGLVKTVLFEYDTLEALSGYLNKQHMAEVVSLFGDETSNVEQNNQIEAPVVAATKNVEMPVENKEVLVTAQTQSSITLPVSQKERLQTALKSGISTKEKPNSGQIAIIGMNGVFPESPDLDMFWQNVNAGNDCIKKISNERWHIEPSGSSLNHWAGLIDNVYHFEAPFFNLSAKEVEAIDPQTRKMMKVSWQAIEDAGYSQTELYKYSVGVYMGVMNDDFTWNVSERYIHTGDYFGYGSFASDIANRISTMLNISGPSLTVETACASSSTAIHMARKAIMNGECEMAIAGGVNLTLHHGKYLMLDSLKLLSPDGKEKTFDDSANGMVPSEGVGAVVLKSLEKAIADGDHIYGVISGSAVGHSGIGPGEHLPSVQSLEKNFVKALEESGVSPTSLSYLECHGTGTALGDPIELKALSNGLRHYSNENHFCAIGTKANFGHLESASGICSLIKVLLSFKHNAIAPCANFDTVNHAYDDTISPFYFPKSSVAWDQQEHKKVAGISSFGLGGSNAFLVLESYENQVSSKDINAQLMVFSANSKEQLVMQITNMLNHVMVQQEINLADVAYTLQTGRKVFPYKVVLVVNNADNFINLAKRFIKAPDENYDGVYLPNAGHKVDKELLLTAIQDRTLDVIAKHWIAGGVVNWDSLHIAGRKKCSLPTYPFIEEEHRLSLSGEKSAKNINANYDKGQNDVLLDANDHPQEWYIIEINNDCSGTKFVDGQLSSLNQISKITQKTLTQLSDVSFALQMTPVQKYHFNKCSDSASLETNNIHLSIAGAVNIKHIKQAWKLLSTKFDLLRSTFIDDENEFYRVVHSPRSKLISTAIHHSTINKMFDDVEQNKLQINVLPKGLPYQLNIVERQEKGVVAETIIHWCFVDYLLPQSRGAEYLHHLEHLYNSLVNNQDIEQPLIKLDESRLTQILSSESDKTIAQFWLEYLKDSKQVNQLINVQSDLPIKMNRVSLDLDSALIKKMQLFTQQYKLQPEVLFIAMWSLIQARLTKSQYALFSTEGLLQSSLGEYDNQTPLLVKTAVKLKVCDWLRSIQETVNELTDVACLPLATVYENVGHDPSLQSSIIFDTSIGLQHSNKSDTKWQMKSLGAGASNQSFLTAHIAIRIESVAISLDYDANQIDQNQAEYIVQLMKVVAREIVENAMRNPAAISLKTDDEKRASFWKTIN